MTAERKQVYPDDAELSIAQAADLFHIGRPILDKHLDEGAIPFHVRGSPTSTSGTLSHTTGQSEPSSTA